MTDKLLREDTAAAFVQLAQANLNAAIMLTEWPERHRLKQLTGELADVRDMHEQHAETLAAKPCDCARRDAYAANEERQREETDEPDPLNEDDHRDRLDGRRLRVKRKSNGYWAWAAPGFDVVAGWTLSSLNASDGPLTFAPEPPPEMPSTATNADAAKAEREAR